MKMEEIRKRVNEISKMQDKLNVDFHIDIGLMISDLKFLLNENDKLQSKLSQLKGELGYTRTNIEKHIPRID